MNWTIHCDDVKRLVFVKAGGALGSAPLRKMSEELRDTVLRHGSKGVLIDYTHTVSRLEPYEIFERPRILQQLNFPVEVKIAVLYSVLDENTQFLENVYRNKNYPVRVFADEAQALAWIES